MYDFGDQGPHEFLRDIAPTHERSPSDRPLSRKLIKLPSLTRGHLLDFNQVIFSPLAYEIQAMVLKMHDPIKNRVLEKSEYMKNEIYLQKVEIVKGRSPPPMDARRSKRDAGALPAFF
ncbi:hypothetical protein EVAR_76758_1 [Eumeta japonica]|uniref:Uncharacterized protein n=1 Tax=Eumeta variegata TaxID=151549 RepID=A0A4C1SWB7_EUMVA|nr:hypothetical protein EVAR_76758_1 [Eumeta japonica]